MLKGKDRPGDHGRAAAHKRRMLALLRAHRMRAINGIGLNAGLTHR